MRRARPGRFRILLLLLVGVCAFALPPSVCPRDLPLGWSAARLDDVHPSPFPAALDADRDGLLDAEENELAQRFAPVVTLHADDRARPASVRWLLGRVGVHYASKPGLLKLGNYDAAVRHGSPRTRDWVTYVHVFPAGGTGCRRSRHPSGPLVCTCGVLIQYWFFYPYNDGPFMFGHEADWEHITVGLDAERSPIGVWAARHMDNDPGRFRPWSQIRKLDGTHPEVLSARGTHASYFDLEEVPWYDQAGRCTRLDGSVPCRHVLWRTWEGGGLQPMGEREAPLDKLTMSNAGRWGQRSLLPGCSAPPGPSFQRGWCAGGAPGCGMYGAY